MGIFDRLRGGTVRIRILIKGPIGDDWKDVDEHVRVPAGTTIGKLLEITDSAKLPLRDALVLAPRLTDTMRLNGETRSLADNTAHVLAEGDEILLDGGA